MATPLCESLVCVNALGWNIRGCNVIVEGTTDVALLSLAAALYYERHRTAILNDQMAILSAGKGDDGGVDGLNRRLNAARQIADADRGQDGSLRYRFIGLYDNDRAGRRGVENACNFDRRLRRCGDLFLLHPVMPLASGSDHAVLRQRFYTDNAKYRGLDWEVEDLLSERVLLAFEDDDPMAVQDVHECGDRKHREFTRDGKYRLHKFVKNYAALEDVMEVVKLIRALRGYLNLQVDHISC